MAAHVLSFHSVLTHHSQADVFKMLAAPDKWADWNKELRLVAFAGEVGVGAQGRLRPRSGPVARFFVSAFERNKLMTFSTFMRGATVHHIHMVTKTKSGTQIAVEVRIEGIGASAWAWFIRRANARYAEACITGIIETLDVA